MDEPVSDSKTTPNHTRIWTGRVISGLVSLTFGASAVMKLIGGPSLEEGIKPLGLPMSMVIPLGILELACAVIYAVPQTAVLGAVLLTGFIGGAICTHWRVGDPFFFQIGIGVLVWLGVYLRDQRLWAVLPLRRKLDP